MEESFAESLREIIAFYGWNWQCDGSFGHNDRSAWRMTRVLWKINVQSLLHCCSLPNVGFFFVVSVRTALPVHVFTLQIRNWVHIGWICFMRLRTIYKSLDPVLLSIIFFNTSLTAAMVQSHLQLCRNALHGSALILSEGVNQWSFNIRCTYITYIHHIL